MVQGSVGSRRPKLPRYASTTSLVMPSHVRTKAWSKLLSWKTSAIETLDRNFRKMAGEQLHGAQSLMDLNFQSFAAQNIDEKQMELDMAAAKMDSLTKELENIWSDNNPTVSSPAQGKETRFSAGSQSSEDKLGKWGSSSIPSLSPSLSQSSNRKLVSSNGRENYVPPLNRSGIIPVSFSPPLSPYNPALAPPVQLSPLVHKNTLNRSISPRPRTYLQPEPKPLVDRPQSPRPLGLSPNYETLSLSQPGRASSPRPMGIPGPIPLQMRSASLDHSPLLHPPMGVQYDYLSYPGQSGRVSSPRPMAPTDSPVIPQAFFPERIPSPRPAATQGYESQQVFSPAITVGSGAFAPFRSADEQAAMRRRSQKSWNESDLDVAYEKKHSQQSGYERDPTASFRVQGVPMSRPWRESSLDAPPVLIKDDLYGASTVSTLPRNYKYNPASGDRWIEPNVWRPHTETVPGTLPRNWQASQQPISRIPIPPSSPQGVHPKQQKPIPLSMIFRLQNAFWEQRNPYSMGGVQGPPGSPAQGMPQHQQQQPQILPHQSPVKFWMASDGKVSTLERAQELQRMPPTIPETGELEPELTVFLPACDLSQAEEVPRPLSPTRLQPILPREAQKMPEMAEIQRVLADIPRPLKRRGSMEQSVSVPQPTNKKQYQQIMSRLFRRSPAKETMGMVGEGAPHMNMPIIIEGSETKVGSTIVQEQPPSPPSPAVLTAPSLPISMTLSPEIRSILKKQSSPKKSRPRRARLNPLVLLLDASLTGELDVVQQAVTEMSDPSLANDEGITALHNAICGANYEIVAFLIDIGINVNSPDSHGWTPLHCAASCNDTDICKALVKHGAAVYAMTFSDGTMAVEKCDPYRDGYKDCNSFLSEAEQSMGVVNNGIVYALWDHITDDNDELSFRQGDTVTILRRDDQDEPEWWWASLYGREGYVPRNYFGLYPRVRAQRSS